MADGDEGAILVATDAATRDALRERMSRLGRRIVETDNGPAVTGILERERIDLAVIDIALPGASGYAILLAMRRDEALREIPVIFVGASKERTTAIAAIEMGAEDYFASPPDWFALNARARAALQKKKMRDAMAAATRELVLAQQAVAADLADASAYLHSILPEPLTGRIRADWRFLPSSALGGDAFGFGWLDAWNFSAYVLDVSGHGVGAALLSASVLSVLRRDAAEDAQTLRQPSAVLGALNDAFPMKTHGGKYFTIWYGVHDAMAGTLRFASAGHPPALLLRGDGRVERLSGGGPPVGIFEGSEYATKSVPFAAGDRLYIYSDGVYELRRPAGTMVRIDDLASVLASAKDVPAPRLDHILESLDRASDYAPADDDRAIVEIEVGE